MTVTGARRRATIPHGRNGEQQAIVMHLPAYLSFRLQRSRTTGMQARHSDPIERLRSNFIDYRQRWPAQAEETALFLELLDDPENPFERARLTGHFTASAWLISADGQRLLLTHHRKLDRWLQLGGHADGDTDLQRVALKEAEEESGLTDLSVEEGIFDLDRHWIPEHKNVPGHWHYDVRYVVRVRGLEAFVISDESNALEWRDIEDLFRDPSLDPSIHRMAEKWSQRAT